MNGHERRGNFGINSLLIGIARGVTSVEIISAASQSSKRETKRLTTANVQESAVHAYSVYNFITPLFLAWGIPHRGMVEF